MSQPQLNYTALLSPNLNSNQKDLQIIFHCYLSNYTNIMNSLKVNTKDNVKENIRDAFKNIIKDNIKNNIKQLYVIMIKIKIYCKKQE